jgi:hypothetical protein
MNLRTKLRFDTKPPLAGLITCQAVNQVSIKLITIARLNSAVDISLNLFI